MLNKRGNYMKNIKQLLFLLIVPTMILSSCGGSEPHEDPKVEPVHNLDVSVKMGASIDTSKSEYDLNFKYDDDFFTRDAKEYDEELSIASFATSVISDNKSDMSAFFETTSFSDASYHEIGKKPTKDTIVYTFAHKNIGQS